MALGAANVGEFALRDMLRPLLVMTVATGIVLAVSKLILRQWQRAAFATTLSVLWLMCYGIFFQGASSALDTRYFILKTFGFNLGKHTDALQVWTGLFVVLGLFFLTRKAGSVWTGALNVMSLVAAGLAFFQLVQWQVGSSRTVMVTDAGGVVAPDQASGFPDIYYIVLDGHGRADTLEEFYGYDMKPFVGELEALGFFVADKSIANYSRTHFSLLSTFNYEHLTTVSERLKAGVYDVWRAAEEGRVIRDLKAAGYETTAITTNFIVDFQTFDHTFFAVPSQMSNFETVLMQSSVPHVILGRQDRAHQFSLEAGIERITDVPDSSAPRFIFAHVLLPHPPFIYNSDGSIREEQFTRNDADEFNGTQADYFEGYRGQVEYTDVLVLETVQELIASAEKPTVIIIQGDHGPGAMFDYNRIELSCMRERFTILNAYYYSEGAIEGLYDEISPVNSFRLLNNQFFGGDFPMVEDEGWYSAEVAPFDFTNITDMIETQECSHLNQ